MANNVFVGTSSSWQTTSNWSTGVAPVAADNVFLTNNSTAINSGLNNATQNITTLNVVMDFTGSVGVNGTANQYLQIASPTANIGTPIAGGGFAPGTSLFNWNAGTTSTSINVYNTSNAGASLGQAPVKLLGSALTINHVGGVLSVGALPSENATVSSVNMAYNGNGISPQAYYGPGTNLGTLNVNGGSLTIASQQLVTALKVARSGTICTHQGTGGYATLQIDAGARVNYNGSGSVNALTITGTIDLSGGGGNVSFGNVTFYRGASFIDPLSRSTFVNTPTIVGASIRDINMDLGQGRYR